MDMSVGRLSVLRAAVAQDADPSNRLAHAVILDLLDRASRVRDDRQLAAWEHFPEAASELVGDQGWPMTVAVVANLVAVVDFAEPVDFLTLSRLVKRYGHRPVATVQSTVDNLLGTSSAMPLVTRYARLVARTDEITDGLVAGGLDHEKARVVAARCHRSGFWLVVTDVDPDAPGPELTTIEEVLRCADSGGVPAWRGQAAIVAANPWGPYPAELHQLLTTGGRPQMADALESLIKYYRDVSEQRDRKLVAREIRRLVAVSGLSQRQFAALCGTSAPRLSTYVNGLVTPSASMMVRFTRVSERAQRRVRRERGSSA
jgi:hypothetical protein